MEYVFPLLVLVGLPLAMLFLFKSNVGVMFLAACTGIVLLGSLDPAVVTTAGAIVPGEGQAYVRLAVVLVTTAFAGLIFKGAVKGSSVVLHFFISILLGLTLWVTLPSATGVSWLISSTDSELWSLINDFRTLIIALGFALSLLAVLTSKRKHHKKGHHK